MGFVQTGAMVGVGMRVTIATGGIGVGPYLAGAGAVGGMSMALDPKVRHSVAAGDWVGAMAHGSYHLPFIGNGRNAWDAWQMGKPWSAAGHAGLFSIEALGMRSAGKVRGVVRGGRGVAKGAAKARKAGTVSKQGKVEGNFKRFMNKVPANSKSSATFKQLHNGNYLFEATSPGSVPGSKAVYQKWVNPEGKTFKMLKTTISPDGKTIHVKSK